MGDRFPKILSDVLNIFHLRKDATRVNLEWHLFLFREASRYMSISDFPEGFDVLAQIFGDEVDGFLWFLERFGPTLLEFGDVSKVLNLAKNSWELEEKLEAINFHESQIKMAVEALGGVLSVEDDDPSPNFENRDVKDEFSEHEDNDIDRTNDISDDTNDMMGELEHLEVGGDELTALKEDLDLDLGTIWKRMILEREPAVREGGFDNTVLE